MGTFRTIWVRIPCAKCKQEFSTGVQFKTGWDGQQDYHNGERLSQDDGLIRGESYPGIYEVYCARCQRQWLYARRSTFFYCLAEFVEEGSLIVRERGNPAALSADHLRRWGAAPVRSEPAEEDSPTAIGPLDLHPFDLIWKGKPAEPYFTKPFGRLFHQRWRQALTREGWTLGTDYTQRNVEVTLDYDLRLRARFA